MANDLEFSLGLDVSPMQRAGASIARFGDETVKVLNRKFSGADIFKSLITGVGLASVGQLADKLVAPFKEASESAQKIAEWTVKAADATDRLLGLRRNDAQQLAAMEKSAQRIANELNDALNKGPSKSFFGFIDRGSALDKAFGFSRREDAKRAELVAQKSAEAEEKAVEVEVKKQAIVEKNFDQEIRNAKLRSDYVKAHREELELEAKLKSGRILPAEKAQLEVLRLQNKEHELNQRIQDILEKFPEERTEAERRTLTSLFQQRDALGRQLDVKQKILASTLSQADAEAKVGEVIESNTAKWEEFKGLIDSVGRGNPALSDRELQRKIQAINDDLFQRSASQLGSFQGNASFGNYDVLGESQKSNLAQAVAELRLREDTRRNVQAFGEDQAFRMFGGTEQRFAEILRGFSNDQEKLTTELGRLNRNITGLSEGLKTL
jgi:hypothetical protein